MSQLQRATRQSWPDIKPLPAQRAPLALQRTFTEQEYDQICLGFIPERMEDKWFIFVEDDTLYMHRSWTGFCIYQLALIKEGAQYIAGEVFANRDAGQYTGPGDVYDAKMVLYLIDFLLLQQRKMQPMPAGVPAGIAMELHHHHVIGAGQHAEAQPIQLTMRGMLGWLGRWLIWLVKR
jgi:hypothetical protein